MLSAYGKFKIIDTEIRIVLNSDFCRYYKWLFKKATYNLANVQTPRYGAHINVLSEKIHKKTGLLKKYKNLQNQKINFQYEITGNFGGFRSGKFVNFWFDVKCPVAEEIAYREGAKKDKNYSLLHITIFSTKGLTPIETSNIIKICKKL